MRRFLETLDTQLLWFAGALAFMALVVGVTGDYPSGKFARPIKSGDSGDVIFLLACSIGLVGLSFIIRSIKNKKSNPRG